MRTINTQDPLLASTNTYAKQPTSGWGFGRGQVVPSLHATWSTQGFGSFWRPIEVGIHFVGLGDGPLSSSPGPVRPGVPIRNEQIEMPGVQHDTDITQRQIDPSWSGTGVPSVGWMPPDDSRAIQAFLTVSFLNPAQSRIAGSAQMWMKVTGLDGFSVAGSPAVPATQRPLGFPASASMLVGANTAGDDIGTGAWFGYLPINAMSNAGGFTRTLGNTSGVSQFPFFSKIVSIPAGRGVTAMSFTGGTITIDLYDISAGPTQSLNPVTLPAGANKIQTITITFPPANSLPIPGLTKYPLIGTGLLQSNTMVAPTQDEHQRVISTDRWNLPRKMSGEWGGFNGKYGRTLIDTEGVADQAGRTASDVLQSMILSNAWSDARLLAVPSVPTGAFAAHPSYGTARLANDLRMGDANPLPANSGTFGKLVTGVTYNSTAFNPASASYHPYHRNPMVPASFPGVDTWDWDNGLGNYADGPWINKADEGNLMANTNQTPYFHNAPVVTPGMTFFSPNRQISSPGTFGSLSTGVSRHIPWQTLLFRPAPPGHPGTTAPGDARLMDLFWMPVVEPYAISEPFSTAGKINLNQQIVPFTYINRYTGLRAAMMGEKVALIRKSDSLVYKSPFPDNPASTTPSRLPINLSESNGTLKQFAEKFASGEIYKSATEICDLYLVPQGYIWPTFQTQWYGEDFALVGDNVREKPYANLYAKLTTKSNSFLVHYRVQALRQTASNLKADPTIFDPTQGDKIVAEQRGSAVVERYLDPADTRFASGSPASFFEDPAAHAANFSLENYYRTRVYNSKIFNP
ncbi:MAG: Verru_Chthon cassette protein A [Chthoniobacterales bacterium]|nr:Verru_Chthon cassette protein A [Chthoniobacterales bacterium]